MNPQFPFSGRCAALALAGVLAACGGGKAPAEATPSLTITAAAPATQSIDRALVVSGSVAAWQEMSLGVEISGHRVADVLVEVGDRVQRGQPLLRLDTRTLQVQARQADAALAQAEANLTLARAENARGKTLLERRLISTADSDELAANLIRAEAQQTAAEADRDAARLNLGFATLVAPHAGVISARTVQPGQVVTPGAELLRLIRDGRLEWRADLAERDLTRVAAGTPVELTAPDGAAVAGKVRAVSPALDPQTRSGLVYVDLPAPGGLRAGMFAQGRIVLGAVSATVVPREAVVFRDGLPYVFVVKAAEGKAAAPLNKVEQRRVAVGGQQDGLAEITSGVAATDQVAVRGAGFLSDGDLVRVVSDAVAAGGRKP